MTVDSSGSDPALTSSGRPHVWPYLVLTCAVALVDILTKLWIQSNFKLSESRAVLGGFFKLTYILNSGGVFGSRVGSNSFYLVSAVGIILIVVYYLFREYGRNRFVDLSLFLVLGGALGNLFDRIRLGAVVDFLDFEFFDFQLLGHRYDRWPTFNVADSAVTIGMLLLIASFAFGFGKPKPTAPDLPPQTQSE